METVCLFVQMLKNVFVRIKKVTGVKKIKTKEYINNNNKNNKNPKKTTYVFHFLKTQKKIF